MTAQLDHADVLIVGGGQGGAQTAISLRQLGFQGTIAIVGDEPEPPYERPPLSKEYFAGDKTFDRLHLRPAAYWSEKAVALITGETVVRVDPESREVETASGRRMSYGVLVWAAGGSPRRMTCEGAGLAGVHAVRSRADIDAILAELPGVTRVAIVGGGYIGLEAAAVLRKFGKAVTLIEAQDRLLARVAGPQLSAFFAEEHRARGVDLRLGVGVDHLEGVGRVAGVVLADGERIAADLVIVGIGITPNVAVLEAAGARTTNGIDVDARCRTSLPDVFAIGDCVNQASRFAGTGRIRIESVPSVTEQAATVARELTGQGRDHDALPWFWSNQYDLKLQTIGLSGGYDQEIVRGDPAARSFSVVYLREGRIIAVDAINAAKDFMKGRAWVTNGATAEVLAT
ncbi:Ferredoxin--NAD(P)(+) reductase fdr [Brevundimonas sp. SH203]|uniref:NAD(P)/FAD-dependent oxidoreductase n=1 Tax=Brevundimonas sp. SH203 TaxID=345167 RepID=UPI0009CF5D98|nr:FAD-dependent oxidoreductase [Brevundimonas sp. SH203]GAW41152.1 Ferredoxin--NAD(P)(+) reductase fdr [Brevundimonas sp. SH203]